MATNTRVQPRLWLRPTLSVALAFCAVALAVNCASACPTCKDALGSHDASHGDIVSGYFWSILFMLSMPPAIIAGLGSVFYWEVRKARNTRVSGPSPGAANAAPTTPAVDK